MMPQPRDVVVWGQYRSGSTNMCNRLVYGIKWLGDKIPDQHAAKFLGEGTGRAGTVGSGWRAAGREITEHLETRINGLDGDLQMPYRSWQHDEDGYLGINDGFGDPFEEITNRLRIIKDGNWKNPVVFKHMGWPKFPQYQQMTSETISGSKKKLYHVATWRADLFDWICSHYVIRKRDGAGFNPHGTYEWDGKHFKIIRQEVKENFLRSSSGLLENYQNLIRDMPKERSVMVELKDMNNIVDMVWPDGAKLKLPTQDQLNDAYKNRKTGENVYLYQGRRIRAADMIDTDLLEEFRDWASREETRLDWKSLPSQVGIKAQPG